MYKAVHRYIIQVLGIFLLLTATLNAESKYKIVVGTYSSEARASIGLHRLNKHLNSHKMILELQEKKNFYSDVQVSGSYHVVLIEPFTDTQVLDQVLEIAREVNKGAFISKMKVVPIAKERTVTDDVIVEVEAKEEIAEVMVVDEKNETLELLQPIQSVQTLKESVPQELKVQQVNHPKQPEEMKKHDIQSEKDGVDIKPFIYMFFGIIVIVLITLVEYYRRKNKTLVQNMNFLYTHDVQENYKNINTLEEFLSQMSEELKKPLHSIVGVLNVLMQKRLDQEAYESLAEIKNATHVSLNIVNDILDISQINAGKLKVQKSNFNINDLLVHIANSVGVKAQEKGLGLVYHVDHSVPSVVVGDVVRLGQIFIGLLENAIKYTQQGMLELHIDTIKKHYESKIGFEFKIIDQGIGIDNETLSSLFENVSHLNLYIIKHLINAMDGSIEVKSIRGEGTEFIVKLYLTKAKINDRRYYRLPSKDLMFKKVIVIGEEYHTNKSLVNMFEYFRYEVKLANTIEVANRLLTQGECDILVIDEVLSSPQSMKQLDDIKEKYNPKIVYLSNISQSKRQENEYVITKPFSQGMIFNLILNLFDNEANAQESENVTLDEPPEEQHVDEIEEQKYSFTELDVTEGLKNCDMSKNTYHSLLRDFVNMYENAHSVLEEMLKEKRYDDAQEFIGDLENFASHLGGNKLSQSAAEIIKVFSQKSYNKLPVLTNLFAKNIEQFIEDIEAFEKEQ